MASPEKIADAFFSDPKNPVFQMQAGAVVFNTFEAMIPGGIRGRRKGSDDRKLQRGKNVILALRESELRFGDVVRARLQSRRQGAFLVLRTRTTIALRIALEKGAPEERRTTCESHKGR